MPATLQLHPAGHPYLSLSFAWSPEQPPVILQLMPLLYAYTKRILMKKAQITLSKFGLYPDNITA